MEITTTMVRFRYPKKDMEKKTSRAQLFLCGNCDNFEKVWVPLNKCEIREDKEDDRYNIVVMPKWLYMKGSLPYYSDAEEFVVTSEVAKEQIYRNI